MRIDIANSPTAPRALRHLDECAIDKVLFVEIGTVRREIAE
jgi:hypothetical protein